MWNVALEEYFREIKLMVSDGNLLRYPYWIIPFNIHTDASDKQFGAVIIHNKKHIAFLSRRLSKPQRNHTTTNKELLALAEFL